MTTLDYLRKHWGTVYDFGESGGRYTATARFGDRQELASRDINELSVMIWHHYPGNTREAPCTGKAAGISEEDREGRNAPEAG